MTQAEHHHQSTRLIQIAAGKETRLPRTASPLRELAVCGDRIAELLERDETLKTLVEHPRLVRPYQDDVVNRMDGFGLPNVARSTRAYGPVGLVPSYIAAEW